MPEVNPKRRRILLDTNVWGNIAQYRQVERVQHDALRHGVRVVACPAVVYEILRTSDGYLRRRDLRAITRKTWLRPMPEIFQQAEQLRVQIKRLHPEWLLAHPDLREWRRLRWDWISDQKPGRGEIGGFWWRARNEPSQQARVLGRAEGSQMQEARESQKAFRAAFQARTFEQTVLSDWVGRFETPVPGWEGDSFSSWRGESLRQWSAGLFDLNTPPVHREWLKPFLDLDLIRDDWAGWVRFWIYELLVSDVPLEWLSWAFHVVASKRRFTKGTPGDSQIGVYLADCEEFVTCDKAFAEITDKIRAEAPCPVANAVLLPDDEGCARGLEELFARGPCVPDDD